jgi:hypothetical protein
VLRVTVDSSIHVEFFRGEPCTAGSPYSKEHRKRAFTREMIRPSGVKTPMVREQYSTFVCWTRPCHRRGADCGDGKS